MTARVDFHIRPGVDYVHTITFQGLTLPEVDFLTEVRSRGRRLLLAPNTVLSAPSTLVVTADSSETDDLATGVGSVTIVDQDGQTWAEGIADIANEGDGAETSTVPPSPDLEEETVQAITVQGIAVPGPPGEDGVTSEQLTLVHVQAIAAAEWRIAHTFTKVLAVTVVDSFHEEVEPDVDLDESGEVVIRANGAFSGEAYLIGIPA